MNIPLTFAIYMPLNRDDGKSKLLYFVNNKTMSYYIAQKKLAISNYLPLVALA